jgi:hypothetical protein
LWQPNLNPEFFMKAASSAYLLIFRESSPERYESLSLQQKRESLDEWNAWCDGLAAEGKLQHGHPLQPVGRVVSAAGVKRPIDGPFAEAKELVGGYILVESASLDEATEIAERCPLLPYGMTVEIRPIAGGCHLATSLGWETMREPAT